MVAVTVMQPFAARAVPCREDPDAATAVAVGASEATATAMRPTARQLSLMMSRLPAWPRQGAFLIPIDSPDGPLDNPGSATCQEAERGGSGRSALHAVGGRRGERSRPDTGLMFVAPRQPPWAAPALTGASMWGRPERSSGARMRVQMARACQGSSE